MQRKIVIVNLSLQSCDYRRQVADHPDVRQMAVNGWRAVEFERDDINHRIAIAFEREAPVIPEAETEEQQMALSARGFE